MTTEHTADTAEHKQSARRRIDHSGLEAAREHRDGLEAAREHRDDLEALADTDLPAAVWAREILDLLDAEDANGGGPA
ncbi:hypothetical protein [Haloarcula sp. H-GB5]